MTAVADLKGKFHAHITLLTDDDKFVAPPGWKTTIILLAKGDRKQKDVMITRHYVTDTIKTPDVTSMMHSVRNTALALTDDGHTVIRQKLEHESLPTLPVGLTTYRECHIKVRKKVGQEIFMPDGFVQSSNPMEVKGDMETVFVNARYYKGDVRWIDYQIMKDSNRLKGRNAARGIDIEVLETKIESTVFDSNLSLDKWWA
jgi:hypothetical protein